MHDSSIGRIYPKYIKTLDGYLGQGSVTPRHTAVDIYFINIIYIKKKTDAPRAYFFRAVRERQSWTMNEGESAISISWFWNRMFTAALQVKPQVLIDTVVRVSTRCTSIIVRWVIYFVLWPPSKYAESTLVAWVRYCEFASIFLSKSIQAPHTFPRCKKKKKKVRHETPLTESTSVC